MKRSRLTVTSVVCLLSLTLGLLLTAAFHISAEAPAISGDASRLTVNSETYREGEPILVSGVGSGLDWVGIYREGAPHSIRWFYVDAAQGGPGSGNEINIRLAPGTNAGEPLDIPAGTYVIRLMPNDSTNIADAIAQTTITVTENPDKPAPDTAVSAPLSATYRLAPPADGFATGSVTVKMPAGETANRSIVMYWADENGKLEGYTSLAHRKVQGEITEISFGANVIIPAGATRLLVYAMNDGTGELSSSCVTVALPDGAAHAPFADGSADLFIMSDIHITTNHSHTHNRNFAHMLQDVASLNRNALGIFVVGDMADTGKEQEYKNMTALYDAAGEVPPLFLTLGNHDLSALPFDEANQLFLRYATLPDGSHPTDTSYDFWLEGYHFIFLGTDTPSGLHAGFTRDTMTWLKEKLDEDRDPTRPAFLFLHQSLNNTVSGSLPGEGWSGVDNESVLRGVLKDYPEVMFFNGHSHWTMDSVGNMYEGNDQLPCRIFNCASVAYLWSGYNVVTGEHLDGSQGYMVRLYDGTLYVLGRDFARGEWIASAQYCIPLGQKETDPEPPVTDPEPSEETTAEPVEESATIPADESLPTPDTTPADTATPSPPTDSDEESQTAPAQGGCASVILPASLFWIGMPLLTGVALRNLRKKREN